MKKGCIIVLIIIAVLFVVAAIAGVIAFNVIDKKIGVRLAPAISHEELANDDTRIRMVIKPDLLAPYLVEYIPEDVETNTYGYEIQEVIGYIVPREIALLLRSDMATHQIRLTLFANEQRGGPFISLMVNEDNPFERIKQIAWTSLGLEMRGRGMLVAEGDLPIPPGVESELLQSWPTRSSQPPAVVQGNNQVELVVDNMNGDILALAAAVATASGESWEKLRKDQAASMAIGVIESIGVARITANMIDNDTAEIDLNITSDPNSGAGLQFLISSVGLPQLKDLLKEDHELILTGDSKWDETANTVVGKYTLTGLNAFIKKQINGQ